MEVGAGIVNVSYLARLVIPVRLLSLLARLFVKTAQRETTRIRTVNVPDVRVDAARMERILSRYAQMYQRPLSEIETESGYHGHDDEVAAPFNRMWRSEE